MPLYRYGSPEARTARKERMSMKRYVIVSILMALLFLPLVVGADDQGWMPPGWTPTPPARPTVDLVQLVQLLRTKGVISDQEYAQLTRPQSSSGAPSGDGRVWRWDEIYHNPVLSKP
jgi:hypothetical protein